MVLRLLLAVANDAGGAIEEAYDTADIVAAADRAAEDSDVVNAGRAVGLAGYGASIARGVATGDGDIVEYQIAHCAGEGLEEGDSEAADAVGHVGGGVDGRL